MMHRTGILLFALASASPALAQQQRAEDPQDNAAIVVTGTPLTESAKRLKDCIARHCPPNEDIDASLAHAENQFIAGDYQAGRETLAASHNRNRRFAADYPVEVADLSRAYGRLTNLSGYPEQGRLLQIDSLEALKSGLASNDSRILIQRIATGDEYVKQGRVVAAEQLYRRVEKQARKEGQFDVAGVAMLRPAILYTAMAKMDASYAGDARTMIRRILETREPEMAGHRDAARILSARLAGQGNDMAALEKAMGELDNQRTDHAVLIYTAPMDLLDRDPDQNYTVGFDTAPQWMDVRFRIGVDGRVEEVEEVRASDKAARHWRHIALESLAKRRYMPLSLDKGANGLVRFERFSYVFDVTHTTGSRMAVRSSQGRVSSMDITPDSPARVAKDKGR